MRKKVLQRRFVVGFALIYLISMCFFVITFLSDRKVVLHPIQQELSQFFHRLESSGHYKGDIRVEMMQVGSSTEMRPIYLISVSNFNRSSKQDFKVVKVLVISGMHPREIITVEATLRFVENIMMDHSKWTGINASFHIDLILMLNPDGFVPLQAEDGCWRWNSVDRKVDLNRNANWSWGGSGSDGYKGFEEYRGEYPFSERESRVVRDLIIQEKYDVFVDLHSGTQQIFCSFVDSESKKIQRTRKNTAKEVELIRFLESVSAGYFQKGGIGYQQNEYSADGTIFDWAAGNELVAYSLTVEIWGKGYHVNPKQVSCFDQFNPSKPNDKLRVVQVFDELMLNIISFLIKAK